MQKIALLADKTPDAKKAYKQLRDRYSFARRVDGAEVVVVLGGDGFMLHMLHRYMDRGVPFFGMNCGTVGFLMNGFRVAKLYERIEQAKCERIKPLHMKAYTVDGAEHQALAVNEVSLLRETRQAAHIAINVDRKQRLKDLVCDGVLVSTAAGSTAYNLSVNGPIIPMGSDLLALTPISPFRPRRWRGALLPHKARITFHVQDPKKRPVSAVADFTEVRDVKRVVVQEDPENCLQLLFDRGHSLEDRIVGEQFTS